MYSPVIILLLGLMASGFAQSKQIIIATIDHDTPRLIVTQNIMNQIYQRLGHSMKLVNYPAKRTLIEVNNGSANGELARASIIEAGNPNLIRIPFPVAMIKVIAVQKKNDRPIQQLSDLENYRIGILRGFVATDKMSTHLTREIYNNLHGLFKGLMHDRVDVVLFSKFDVEHYLQKYQLEENLVMSEKVLMEIPLYHYLHNNSANIAQTLTQEMQKMYATGELQNLIQSQEQSFLDAREN